MLATTEINNEKNEMEDITKNAIKKEVSWSIDSINRLKEESGYYVEHDNDFFKNAKASIKYEEGKFLISIICNSLPSREHFNDLEQLVANNKLIFRKSGRQYEVDGDSIQNVTEILSDPSILKYETKHFKAVGENKRMTHRLIIPTGTEPNLEPFQRHKITVGSILYFGLLHINVKGNSYECFKCSNKDLRTHYLIIDSKNEVSIEEFVEESESILLAIALITGNYYSGERYTLTFEDKENYWKYDSIEFDNSKNPVITNTQLVHPYEFKSYLKHLKREDLLNKISLFISSESLSKVVNNILNDVRIQRLIMLILEGNATNSLILRSSIYSVGLETISGIICKINEQKLKPIQDEKLGDIITKRLLEALKEYEAILPDKSFEIFSRTIKSINKPTNSAKLEKPFELMGVVLNDNDKATIKHRNIFLHGSSPVKGFETSREKKVDLILIGNKMHLLLNCLLLKYLGYSGHVTNHYVFKESRTRKTASEDFFRII